METIKNLIVKRLREALTAEEEKTLEDWMAQSLPNRALVEEISDPKVLSESFSKLDSLHTGQVWERIRAFSETNGASGSPGRPTVRRMLRNFPVRYAATVLLLAGTIGFLWFRHTPPQVTAAVKTNAAPDVPAPSSTRAAITLANGKKIFIDSAAPGLLAKQGNIQIRKMNDGSIAYTGTADAGTLQYNTLTVPRGSQIASVVLSDGSKVFLNAASSLSYPTAFSRKERRLQVSGEAYFEVASDVSRKFIVVGGGMTTQVLGTHFNVNSYPDEAVKNVTLLEGRVKVSEGVSNLVIQPGQQASSNEGIMNVKSSVDVNQVMAWKNGLFNFQDLHLPEVMRQLARWYDLQVIYEKKVPDIEFFGQMGRNLKLSNVLEVLAGAGVKFRLEEGRRLFIM